MILRSQIALFCVVFQFLYRFVSLARRSHRPVAFPHFDHAEKVECANSRRIFEQAEANNGSFIDQVLRPCGLSVLLDLPHIPSRRDAIRPPHHAMLPSAFPLRPADHELIAGPWYREFSSVLAQMAMDRQ